MQIRKALAGISIGLASMLTFTASATPVVNVGSTPTGMPFTYLDPATNTIESIMVDIIKEVGKDVGFTPNIIATSFSTLISTLNTNRIDIIAAAMGKSPEREKVVSFTDKILSYGEGLVVPESNDKQYTSFADMKGMTVGIQLGTVYVAPAQASGMFKEIKQYDSSADMLRDLKNGRVEAVLLDYPIAQRTLQQPQFQGLRLVDSYKPVVPLDFSLIVRKDDTERLEVLNKSIKKLTENGTISAILKKWGLE